MTQTGRERKRIHDIFFQWFADLVSFCTTSSLSFFQLFVSWFNGLFQWLVSITVSITCFNGLFQWLVLMACFNYCFNYLFQWFVSMACLSSSFQWLVSMAHFKDGLLRWLVSMACFNYLIFHSLFHSLVSLISFSCFTSCFILSCH